MGRCSIIAALLLLIAAAPAWSADPPPPPPPPAVTVASPLEREVVEWDEFTGQFAAIDYVELRARVSGYLTSIHFADGQIVKKGDLLFVIDPRPFEATLANARAMLAQSEARLALARQQLARASTLRQRDFIPAATFDERNQDVRVGIAAIEAARAQVRSAELDVGFTRVTAPVAGRVGRHLVSVGNLVAGGNVPTTTLLTTVVSLDPIHFYFDLSETELVAYQRAAAEGRLKATREGGVVVQARLADERTWVRDGIVDFVDNQVDRSAGTIRARARFPNPKLFLTPGQFARLRLPGSMPYKAVQIPDSAVVTDQSQKLVMVVKDDDTIEPRTVRLGPMEDGLRIVRSGLGPADRIVINGLMRARPGAKVTPQAGKIEVPAPAPAKG